jgi:hypothetical protein
MYGGDVEIQCKLLMIFMKYLSVFMSRDSSVSIANSILAGHPRNWCSIASGGQEIFLYSITSRPALRPTQPSAQWVPGSVFPGIKRPGLDEADHSLPSSAEVGLVGGGVQLGPLGTAATK